MSSILGIVKNQHELIIIKKLNKLKYLLFLGLLNSETAGVSALSLPAVSGVDWVPGVAVSAYFLLHIVLNGEGIESGVDSRGDAGCSSEDLANLLDHRSLLKLAFAKKVLAGAEEAEAGLLAALEFADLGSDLLEGGSTGYVHGKGLVAG